MIFHQLFNKTTVFLFLILAFLLFSFYPTIFELSRAHQLTDPNREFILEHNYYWPDFNLYLSKIRQGFEGHLTAQEKYTSEKHQGSLIQEFYLILGHLGRLLSLDPNFSYQFGRLIFSPLLLLIILMFAKYYFPPNLYSIPGKINSKSEARNSKQIINHKSEFSKQNGIYNLGNWNLFRISDLGFRIYSWQLLAFLVVIVSGSFPRLYTDSQGILHIGRFMEWWSNIDALQRLTFIPHILFGQVVSFYLLYHLTVNRQQITIKGLLIYILLGNAVGIVFPPSLITLNGTLVLLLLIKIVKKTYKSEARNSKQIINYKSELPKQNGIFNLGNWNLFRISDLEFRISKHIGLLGYWVIGLFTISTLPSLLYLFIITKHLPWSALVDFHRTHPMMIPFDQYLLGTGPIFILGLLGAILSIIKRERQWQPLILWVLVTFGFAAFFSVVKEQSPLRFTQTGLFIPLGILGTYFFYQLFHLSDLSYLSNFSKSIIRTVVIFLTSLYLFSNLYTMKVSLDWQTTWISQRLGASIPPVPYPPQTMYPLRSWMDGIRWLRDNTNHNDVVLAEITAGNFIPAYSGNTVYFGQSNTVDYERKKLEVDKFFSGKMTESEAKIFLQKGRIKYIFFSLQEKEKLGGKNLEEIYPFLDSVFTNPLVQLFIFF